MRVLRSSYGLLGIVFEVTFGIQPTVLLHTNYASFRLNPPPTRDEMLGGADGMLGIALPYANRIVVERRCDPSGPQGHTLGEPQTVDPRPAVGVRRESVRHRVALRLVLPAPGSAPRPSAQGIEPARGLRRRAFGLHDRLHGRAPAYFDFTFCAVPMSAWQEFVPAYLRFCKDFRRETGFCGTLLSEVYVMSRDEHSLLSPTATEECFTMDVTDTRMGHPRWKEFNRASTRWSLTTAGGLC